MKRLMIDYDKYREELNEEWRSGYRMGLEEFIDPNSDSIKGVSKKDLEAFYKVVSKIAAKCREE